MIYPLWGPVEGMFTEPQLHHIRMLYAEKVTMVDKWLGYLMDQVKAMGLEDNTLFLMVSDHGHPFGEGSTGTVFFASVGPGRMKNWCGHR